MWKDPVVEEVRRIREVQAAQLDYDITAIIESARRRQAESSHPVLPSPVPGNTGSGNSQVA